MFLRQRIKISYAISTVTVAARCEIKEKYLHKKTQKDIFVSFLLNFSIAMISLPFVMFPWFFYSSCVGAVAVGVGRWLNLIIPHRPEYAYQI